MLKYTPREEVYGSKAAGRRVKEQFLSLSKYKRKGQAGEAMPVGSSGACTHRGCLIYLSDPTAPNLQVPSVKQALTK